jgi:cytidyltransferase-like protein
MNVSEKLTVYAYVVGDLLHVGHLRALQQARELGDYLIVGVLTDKAVEAYKRTPIIPFDERIELIENLRCVDIALPQEDVDPTENLRALDVDVVVHGDDWGEDFPGAAYMKGIGKEAIRTQYFDGQSTTKIIEDIYERFQRDS